MFLKGRANILCKLLLLQMCQWAVSSRREPGAKLPAVPKGRGGKTSRLYLARAMKQWIVKGRARISAAAIATGLLKGKAEDNNTL